MELSSSQMETIKHQFDYLCRRCLRNENCNLRKQEIRRAQREIELSGLPENALVQLQTVDVYLSKDIGFEVLGYYIVIENENLADSLLTLSEEKRNILLLAYFFDMNDREIGETLNMVQRTVQYRRTVLLKELRIRLEAVKNGQAD